MSFSDKKNRLDGNYHSKQQFTHLLTEQYDLDHNIYTGWFLQINLKNQILDMSIRLFSLLIRSFGIQKSLCSFHTQNKH